MASLSNEDVLLWMAMEEDDEELVMMLSHTDEENVYNYKDVIFDIDKIGEKYFWTEFRFEKNDIQRLIQALRIPDPIFLLCRNQVSATFGLCLLLRRLAYPCRLSDLQPIFGYSTTTLSAIILHMTDYIFTTHKHLLKTFQQKWLGLENIKTFSEKVAARGSPLQNCWGFIDGTARPISRPSYGQKDVFSGHKRTHVLKYQGVMVPNGLFACMHGPFEGKRHDSGILKDSGLFPIMEEKMNSPTQQPYCLYGDPAYPLRNHLMCPFKGSNSTTEEEAFNKAIATVRQCVEWGFGKAISLFAFLD